MRSNSFPYSYRFKILGLVIMLAGLVSVVVKFYRKGIFDVNEIAIGFSWGLVFIFFSKEKNDDEMMQTLKFKALSRALIIAFFITHLYNYLFLNWRYKRMHDEVLSISAYQFMALTLLIATAGFYYMKSEVISKEPE